MTCKSAPDNNCAEVSSYSEALVKASYVHVRTHRGMLCNMLLSNSSNAKELYQACDTFIAVDLVSEVGMLREKL